MRYFGQHRIRMLPHVGTDRDAGPGKEKADSCKYCRLFSSDS